MSRTTHQFSKQAFRGFLKREGRGDHEDAFVLHAYFDDQTAGASYCIKGLKAASASGKDAVSLPLDVINYALRHQERICNDKGEPIPDKFA